MPEEKTIEKMQDLILSALGEKKTLHAIIKALDPKTKKDVYEYIIKRYDLENGPKEK